MSRALAFGAAFGAAVQAWRNWPADGPVSTDMAVVVSLVAILCAFIGGRARRRPAAVAVASARAEANASAVAAQRVQVVNVVAGQGAGSAAGGVRLPSDSAVWLGDQRRQLDSSELEGMDLSELLEEQPEHLEGRGL